MVAASDAGYTVWRNNVGMAWQGTETYRRGKDVLLVNARPVYFGLCEGSSDLIGIRRVIVTPEMAGDVIAQFVAIEVKRKKGKASAEQEAFLEFIRENGGVAMIARSALDIRS